MWSPELTAAEKDIKMLIEQQLKKKGNKYWDFRWIKKQVQKHNVVQ